MIRKVLTAAMAAGLLLAGSAAQAQDQARLAWQTFHSRAIEGNLEGNSADRTVLVVTPPGYEEHPTGAIRWSISSTAIGPRRRCIRT